MNGLTRAKFARLQGVARSTVTRWEQAGRLVLTDDGEVDAEASVARIRETSGNRADVAARHAAQRAAAEAAQPEAAPPEDSSRGRGLETRAEAQARKESLAADLLELDLAARRGELLAREDVEAAMRHVGATVRSLLDVLPDQIAPLVAPVTDLEECHGLLSEACRDVLVRLGEAVERAKRDAVRCA